MKTPLAAVVVCALGIVAIVAGLRGAPTIRSTTHRSDGVAPQGVVRSPGGPGQGGVTGFDIATHLTNEDLTTQSDVIVIGKAVETKILWTDDGRNLYTVVTVAVEETLKGEHGATVTVALPGGLDANRPVPIAMTYPGAPQIAPDEEVFLFLTHADDEVSGSHAITGFAQGKFSIVAGDPGTPMVSRNLSGLRVQGDPRMVRGGDTWIPLAAFKEEIVSYLKQ